MSANGWNSNYANHARPNGSNLPLLACRVCDQIFLTTRSLMEHYESHQDELAQRRQGQLRNYQYSATLQPQLSSSFTLQPHPRSSFTLQQRHHPYLPNGYRTWQPQFHGRNPVVNTSPFLVSSRTPSMLQPRNSVTNRTLAVPSLNPLSVPGRGSVNNYTLQFVIRQNTQISLPNPSMSSNSASGAQTVQFPETVWYLDKMEEATPNIINLGFDSCCHQRNCRRETCNGRREKAGIGEEIEEFGFISAK